MMRGIVALVALSLALVAPAVAATPNHIVIVVRDMQAGRKAFEAAGFSVGHTEKISGGFWHAIVPFGDGSYLELINATKRTAEDAAIFDLEKLREGPVAAGYLVADIAATRKRLRDRGFKMAPPAPTPYWTTLSFADPAGVMGAFFYIAYKGNSVAYFHKRYPVLLAHSNGANALFGVDVEVEPGTNAGLRYISAGLQNARAFEDGAGDPRIVLVRVTTNNASFKHKTIEAAGTRIFFQ